MPAAKKGRTKKDADAGEATATKTRRKSRQVEAEADDEEDDEDEEVEESTSTRRRITPEIAERAAEMREEGATWTEIIEETGFNGAQLRPHIARLTEATIDTLEDTPESVAEHREQGYAWYAMAVSLDKTVAEVKEMAEEGGADTVGRKYRSNGGAEAEADVDEDEDVEEEEEEEEQPKPRRRGRAKATSNPTPSKTAGKKRPSKAS
jgi:hypothetical protein